MLAPDMNARYIAITLEIALEEVRKANLPEPTYGVLVSLLTIAKGATAELCDALQPQCAVPAAHRSTPPSGNGVRQGNNILQFRRAL